MYVVYLPSRHIICSQFVHASLWFTCGLIPFKACNLFLFLYAYRLIPFNLLPDVCTLYVVSTCCMFPWVFACCSFHFVYTLYLWGNEGKTSMMRCRLSSMMMKTKNGYLTSILLHTTLNLR
jgi:hypothetical protein